MVAGKPQQWYIKNSGVWFEEKDRKPFYMKNEILKWRTVPWANTIKYVLRHF